jgi:cytochrome c peroxidase
MATFTFIDSPWDKYLNGDLAALSNEGRMGAELFFGEAGCSSCHNGPLLTDQEFYNIGIPQLGPGKEEDAPFDTGHQRISHQPENQYAFRTPPLRNVALTGPWMHNGAFTSLEDAVRHHLDVVSSSTNYDAPQLQPELIESVQSTSRVLDNLAPEITHKIELTEDEFSALIVFLNELTSPSAVDLCDLIPDAVPSGLPLDTDPAEDCF